ncbi:uncharacterized protein EDB93DRAFT_1153374 [Suillus bovinus]|uniref:uncharacterized protein n=1 Tax=Suillus bovinus TaxID=48563 RepID=UPI001B86A5FE|nr:uncharacterized protein EDB93DRAFT_1153374 [Suillus bovinus]KAG2144414.1 hypothetical protein EDB93DRAFT_1153374 [Suillus bovinus]
MRWHPICSLSIRKCKCLVAPYTNCVQKPCSSFRPRKHHQYSAMKFTSLTTIVISAASMAGIAIASEDLSFRPEGLPCRPKGEHSCGLRADLRPRTYSLSTDTLQCSSGIVGYNDGYDFAFYCGDTSTIIQDIPCNCNYCCKISPDKQGYTCGGVSLSSHAASGVRVFMCLSSISRSGRESCDLVSI